MIRPARRAPRLAALAGGAALSAIGLLAVLSSCPAAQAQGDTAVASTGSTPDGAVKHTHYGGPFALVDQDGRKVTDADFRGKWMLIYFGYTHCPDACPTALNDMAEALDRLPEEERRRVQPIFVTVDPERDTPAVMKDYVGAFPGTGIIGLTGTQEQVAQAAKAYRVVAKKRPREDDPGEYSMDHSSNLYIMDPEGRFAALTSHLLPPERLAKRLAELLRGSPGTAAR